MRRGLVAVVVVLLAVGCGEDELTPPAEGSGGRVYLLQDGKVWPVFRDAPLAGDAADEIVAELLLGPSDEELERGMTTALPDDLEITGIVVEDGVANVPLDANLTPEALAQLVYTLTGLPTVRSVDLDRPTQVVTGFDRSDFEEQTPAILVESPLADEEVASPLSVTGTANTFEANFQYELEDDDGRVIAKDFVTATSGTGTRGTFQFDVTFDHEGDGTLVVYESSAKDGSRINVAEIPLRMTR